jgi:predicted HTH domain antitoxin
MQDDAAIDVIRDYLSQSISLSRAAEQLGLSRFELMERFERLNIPLRLGPETKEEAQREVDAALEALRTDK